ncbi:thioredoxin domain-containing protein [Leptospira sp. 96542]|nr:thioredoxin domain-containing protein [Leptospira sp. 96542]
MPILIVQISGKIDLETGLSFLSFFCKFGWGIFLFHLIFYIAIFCSLFFCSAENAKIEVLNNLYSELEIKQLLSDSEVITSLKDFTNEKYGLGLEEWKLKEKEKVSDFEITHFIKLESKGIFPIEVLEKERERIRTRIVWTRILNEVGVKPKPSLMVIPDPNIVPNIIVKNPKWTIVEWSDYNCSFCKKSFPENKKIQNRYEGKISWYYLSFPLEPDNKEGRKYLTIARCLWKKYPEQYESLQTQLYKKEIVNHLGCVTEKELAPFDELVVKDYKKGSAIGVRSIPTFQINGRWIVGAMDLQSWEKALKQTEP